MDMQPQGWLKIYGEPNFEEVDLATSYASDFVYEYEIPSITDAAMARIHARRIAERTRYAGN